MLDQAIILLCGATAVWLSQCGQQRWRRWACWVGLLAQPSWFHTSFTHGQWSILISCLFYAAGWLRGVWIYWLGPWWRDRRPGR